MYAVSLPRSLQSQQLARLAETRRIPKQRELADEVMFANRGASLISLSHALAGQRMPLTYRTRKQPPTRSGDFVGAGGQFETYDLGNGLLEKRLRSLASAVLFRVLRRPRYLFEPAQLLIKASHDLKKAETAISTLARHPAMCRLLCNFRVDVTNHRAVQDRVTPLAEVAASADARVVVELLIRYTFDCWSLGMGDLNPTLLKNYGVTRAGKLALYDIGSLSFNKEEIAAALRQRPWHTNSTRSRTALLPAAHTYLTARLDEELTPEALDMHWNSRKIGQLQGCGYEKAPASCSSARRC